MDLQSVGNFISTIGFPCFVAIWMLVKDSKDKEKLREALEGLKVAIQNMCQNCTGTGTGTGTERKAG